MRAPEALLASLRAAVGDRHVVTDPGIVASHTVDWTGRFHGTSAAVVRPGDTSEVAAVLRACHEHRIAVVPQGGNTGLVGGSVPHDGEIVCDLRRLDGLDAVDDRAGHVVAGAGVTIARLRAHADAAGWSYGVDLGSRDTATVGGTIATNAGGLHVLRYGATRHQVVGVEAVLADGRVVGRTDALEKDNTGYDLAGLLCGSEGTLAIVTGARLRLHPRLAHTVVALCAFDDVDAALDAVGVLRRSVDCVNALEFFVRKGLDLVCERLQLPQPFPKRHAAFVLVEAAASTDPTATLAAAVARCGGVGDVAVSTDSASARALWRYREGHTEAINLLGAPHKLDVALPARDLGTFLGDVEARVRTVAPGAEVWLFGHAGDGNVHVNITGVDPDDERAEGAVLGYVAALRGSISAEHGIGTAKRKYLPLVRTVAEIATYRAIKDALDPGQILNPHVMLP